MHITYTDNPIDDAAELAYDRILAQLKDERAVLWLLSGGSSEMIAVKTLQKLRGSDLSRLYITMTDERFVAYESENENWQRLIDLGMPFELLPEENIHRPLFWPEPDSERSEKSLSMNDWIHDKLAVSDYTLAVFGIGDDGHTLGLKPHSTALDSELLVDDYTGEDFERITLTPLALDQIDEGILQVSGEAKRIALNQLFGEDSDFHDQPAQLLKTIPKLTVFTSLNQEKMI